MAQAISWSTRTVTLTNTGQLPLQVNQNGITLINGTHYKIVGVSSSTQGTINLASGSATLRASSAETWTSTLQFDPLTAGLLSDTLLIASNDPINPTTSIALNGTGFEPADSGGHRFSGPEQLNVGFPRHAGRRFRRTELNPDSAADECRHTASTGGEKRIDTDERHKLPRCYRCFLNAGCIESGCHRRAGARQCGEMDGDACLRSG